MGYRSIRPGQVWLDTNGERIQAHGGSVRYEDGIFYWYGENKDHTTGRDDTWHWGIRCYSSRDLYNWEDLGLIIPPEPDDETSPLHPAQKVDRPHILRNPHTGQYVCWLKIMGEGHEQRSTVLVSDSLLGPYEIVRTGLQPLGMNAGDFDLTTDPATGNGYYYFEKVHTELICAELTDDYTDVSGTFSSHFPHAGPPDTREAPAYFTRKGKHYLITSGTTGYLPNRSQVAVADDFHGPWTVLGAPHVDDPSGTSFQSQVSSVFKHPTVEDLYIAVADRWMPDLDADEAAQVSHLIRRVAQGELTIAEARQQYPQLTGEVNTSLADYVWLPLVFDGDMPRIHWHEEWRVEDRLGVDERRTL